MRLAVFSPSTDIERVGVVVDDMVIDVSHLVSSDGAITTGQVLLTELMDAYDSLKPDLQRAVRNGDAIKIADVQLLAPIPRPGKVLCCIGNYWEHATRDPRPLNMFLKNPDAVIGPGKQVVLPDTTEPWIFMHEAELAIVIKGPAKSVKASDWRQAVFGYTCLIDVSAREEGRRTWRSGSWMGKSFDTFCPVGPYIVTADDIDDPNQLRVKLWNNGELRHDYSTQDMEHYVPDLIEFASNIMTLQSGDLIACGTNHEGLGAIQDGEELTIDIEAIGSMSVSVSDPLRRGWERGIYMGVDSTNHEAIRKHRPEVAQHLVPDANDDK